MSEKEFNVGQIFEAIKLVAKQNFISEEETKVIIEDAVKKAFHSKFDPDAELVLTIDENKEVFELINNSKLVVADEEFSPEYRSLEISLTEAKKLNKSVKLGDNISEIVAFEDYASILAQSIRQMFTQQVREKKKEIIYSKHKGLKGEMVDVIVSTISNNYVIFLLEDGTTAFMPTNFRNPNIKLKVGQKTKVFVEDVLEESKDAQIIVSNGSKEVVKRILEDEVPEVSQGIVEIVALARVPGVRTKVAVRSNSPDVDPVGAIIGERGSRISTVIEKLDGEKLDIIEWNVDENIFAANALAPAKIVSVIDKVNPEGEKMKGMKVAIAPDRHQTLAIGKRGSNVKLAVELTGIKLDVISISESKVKGIEIIWNTGITEDIVKAIEEGKRLTSNFKSNRSNKTTIQDSEMDNEIEAFSNSISEDIVETNNFDDFQIDEDLFTDEALKDMEADFEFDNEIGSLEGNEEESKED